MSRDFDLYEQAASERGKCRAFPDFDSGTVRMFLSISTFSQRTAKISDFRLQYAREVSQLEPPAYLYQYSVLPKFDVLRLPKDTVPEISFQEILQHHEPEIR